LYGASAPTVIERETLDTNLFPPHPVDPGHHPAYVLRLKCFFPEHGLAEMALTIENPEAERLAQELAELSGHSLTDAVIQALDEKLQRLKSRQPDPEPDLVRKLKEISARCSALPDVDTRSPDEILGYDEHGGFR